MPPCVRHREKPDRVDEHRACSIGTSLRNKADIPSHMETAWRPWPYFHDNTLCCDCSSRHSIPIPWVRDDVKECCGWTEEGVRWTDVKCEHEEERKRRGRGGVCIALCAKIIFHSSVSSPGATHFKALSFVKKWHRTLPFACQLDGKLKCMPLYL